jgi:pimeloyl-ACP methyl ester carboxylesterase
MRTGWGRESPAFWQLFTGQFFPEHTRPELVAHFNALLRSSCDPESAARYLESCHSRGDGNDIFPKIKTPTLVVHQRGDMVCRFEEGRHLASLIPGAKFSPISGISHCFPTDQPETIEVVEAITRFLGS